MPLHNFTCSSCGSTREVFIYHKDYERYIVRCSVDYFPMERV